jgi:hypothetical protein
VAAVGVMLGVERLIVGVDLFAAAVLPRLLERVTAAHQALATG